MDSKTIIDRLGGPSEVARLCGDISPQAVSQWYGKDAQGKDRSIPKGWHRFLKEVRPDAFQEPQGEERTA